MPEFTLQPLYALNGYAKTFGENQLRELTELKLMSLAVPLGREALFESASAKAFGLLPLAGQSAVAAPSGLRLVSMGPGQFLAIFSQADQASEALFSQILAPITYTTDQTDGMVALALSGPLSRQILQRTCAIDLDPAVFTIDSAARTSMEHMGATVIRTDHDHYLLLSASSSAKSFLHMLETSIKNVMAY